MPPRANPVRRTTLQGDTPTSRAISTGQATVFQPASAAPPAEHVGVAPIMISSLPDMASGADVYARQFYRGSRVPWRRYLPIIQQ